MVHCGSLMKSTLVAVVLLAVIHSGSAAEKLASCCKTVTGQKIKEPITGYMVQRPNPPCVPELFLRHYRYTQRQCNGNPGSTSDGIKMI
uniref:Chemokine interleukin-8-like domain-containing protein n=1 Tax=Mola mola TaxID=94237 RepID=A0A3Q3WTU8_MOLML